MGAGGGSLLCVAGFHAHVLSFLNQKVHHPD
jgi:hypothetical protein